MVLMKKCNKANVIFCNVNVTWNDKTNHSFQITEKRTLKTPTYLIMTFGTNPCILKFADYIFQLFLANSWIITMTTKKEFLFCLFNEFHIMLSTAECWVWTILMRVKVFPERERERFTVWKHRWYSIIVIILCFYLLWTRICADQ